MSGASLSGPLQSFDYSFRFVCIFYAHNMLVHFLQRLTFLRNEPHNIFKNAIENNVLEKNVYFLNLSKTARQFASFQMWK